MPQSIAIRGVVEGANRNGIKIDGRWHNYGRAFQGERLLRDAIGGSVELELDGEWIRAVRAVDPPVAAPEKAQTQEAAAAAPGPALPAGEKTITPNQASKIAELADNREIAPDRLDLAAQILTGRPVGQLTLSEASGLLQMLGARPLSSRRRFGRRYD